MTFRCEIFPADLDSAVDFYTEVLGFRLVTDRRTEPTAYVALEREDVRIGAAARPEGGHRTDRRPPTADRRPPTADRRPPKRSSSKSMT